MTNPLAGVSVGVNAIGREGLAAFCDQLNAGRVAAGIREQYFLAERDGKLTLCDEVHGVRA